MTMSPFPNQFGRQNPFLQLPVGTDGASLAAGSYTIPTGDLTLQQRMQARQQVDVALVTALLAPAIRQTSGQLMLRDIRPHTDLGVVDTSESWLVNAAGVAGTFVDIVPAFQVKNNVAHAYYGFSLVDVNQLTPPAITEIGFIYQTGFPMQLVHVERMQARLEPEAYLSEFVVYNPQDNERIQVMPITGGFAAATVRVPLLGRMVEPSGVTVLIPPA